MPAHMRWHGFGRTAPSVCDQRYYYSAYLARHWPSRAGRALRHLGTCDKRVCQQEVGVGDTVCKGQMFIELDPAFKVFCF